MATSASCFLCVQGQSGEAESAANGAEQCNNVHIHKIHGCIK